MLRLKCEVNFNFFEVDDQIFLLVSTVCAFGIVIFLEIKFFSMGNYFGFWFLLSFCLGFHLAQDSVESICRICGDTVNEYCCRYFNSCCEFINPNGCPPEASPGTRLACHRLIRCTNSSHCSLTQRCCRNALCGPTCSNVTFAGYKY